MAVIFFTLGAPFGAGLEVIVYAGAIMVLFVFVTMMLALDKLALDAQDARDRLGVLQPDRVLAVQGGADAGLVVRVRILARIASDALCLMSCTPPIRVRVVFHQEVSSPARQKVNGLVQKSNKSNKLNNL